MYLNSYKQRCQYQTVYLQNPLSTIELHRYIFSVPCFPHYLNSGLISTNTVPLGLANNRTIKLFFFFYFRSSKYYLMGGFICVCYLFGLDKQDVLKTPWRETAQISGIRIVLLKTGMGWWVAHLRFTRHLAPFFFVQNRLFCYIRKVGCVLSTPLNPVLNYSSESWPFYQRKMGRLWEKLVVFSWKFWWKNAFWW